MGGGTSCGVTSCICGGIGGGTSCVCGGTSRMGGGIGGGTSCVCGGTGGGTTIFLCLWSTIGG